MRRPSPLALAFVVAAVPAAALTPADIETGAARATANLRSVTRRLAAENLAGRDNATPESERAQAMLIRRLRHLGAGIGGAGADDDAYRQPFVQGQAGTNLLAIIPGRELPDEYVV